MRETPPPHKSSTRFGIHIEKDSFLEFTFSKPQEFREWGENGGRNKKEICLRGGLLLRKVLIFLFSKNIPPFISLELQRKQKKKNPLF